ncbi:hypothetical protein PRIPAC_75453 [Pristionchus pacificus]|uniref:Tyr recombinase domain-containing protein n=1 Tax=Pristionchus pacificus TaxID=54126 RepID=A0A2A6CT45_PRIPA|nr:hypothetical protein PRIPAC_75453 [Pristionchus pacificus]|eukprot:PDM81278.1 hypothetical protein PRIPAC_36281 [Pristionchus pacificus]
MRNEQWRNPTDFAIVRCALGAALAYGALLRVSELISLRWSDLSWSEGRLRVSIRKAKNDQFSEGRETFISIGEESETLSLFDSYRSQVPLSVWVFPSISHPISHITSDSFRKDLYSLCSRSRKEEVRWSRLEEEPPSIKYKEEADGDR